MEGLRPSFSAHVRWCEHGAPVKFCLVLGSGSLSGFIVLREPRREGLTLERGRFIEGEL
jgi:hypothetical protein